MRVFAVFAAAPAVGLFIASAAAAVVFIPVAAAAVCPDSAMLTGRSKCLLTSAAGGA